MRSSLTKRLPLSVLVAAVCAGGFAGAQIGAEVENWSVPEWSGKALDISRPVSFVAMAPCRIVDTRGPAGSYGGPALPPNTQRDFDLDSGPCTGIPAGVAGYSLNFTVTQTQGFGDLRAWPQGSAPPLVSTLNYVPNQTVANAAIVPAGTNGGISVVAAVSGTHLIIDINGYFTNTPNFENNWEFTVQEQGNSAIQVTNTEPSAAGSSAVGGIAQSTGNGSFGVIGRTVDTNTGHENGGVYGRAGNFLGAIPTYGQAGVRGESLGSFGVLGISRDQVAVAGSNLNSSLAEATWAALGCSDTVAVCGSGTVNVSGVVASLEPHATDAARVIKYAALEGNEAGTYFRGRAKFERGMARIRVPEDFRMVTGADGLSIQVTPIGEMASVAVVRIDLNEIVVKASRNVDFFYTVNGVRKGYENFEPVAEMQFFAPRTARSKMPTSLSPEAKRKLIANGTYNADGTVNMETAERLGWTEKWKGSGAAPEKD